jgi:hypothetical protein
MRWLPCVAFHYSYHNSEIYRSDSASANTGEELKLSGIQQTCDNANLDEPPQIHQWRAYDINFCILVRIYVEPTILLYAVASANNRTKLVIRTVNTAA